MPDPHSNFAYSTVLTAPSPAASGTSLVVQAADGAKFPTGGSFNATVWPVSAQPTSANAEIVRVTAISTDTFTITRAQESTSARAIVVGDQIAATVTAKTLTDVELEGNYLTSMDQSVPANTQAIFDDYLELAASFVYEIAAGAEVVVGSYATPLPLPDQNTNIFISVADETIPKNSEIIFGDYYEVSAPFTTEVAGGGLLQVGTGTPITTLGQLALVYRYTIVAATKASIDTGVDVPDAGSNDWTNGDLLEVYFYGRTDEAVVGSQIDVTFNNDTSALYDVLRTQDSAGTVTGATSASGTKVFPLVTGASAAASEFGEFHITIPNYTTIAGFKTGTLMAAFADNPVATTSIQQSWAFTYRALPPITRLKVIPDTAAKNFVTGSQLVIYKRLAS